MKALVLLVVILCLFFDITRNTSLAHLFIPETEQDFFYWFTLCGWIAGLACLALLPVVLSSLGHLTVAYRAALLSALVSLCAVSADYVQQENSQASIGGKYAQYTAKIADLKSDLAICDTKPSSVCTSQDIRKNLNFYEQKLAQLETSTIFKSEVDDFMQIIKLIILSLFSIAMPYFTASCSNVLAKREPIYVQEPSGNQKVVPTASKTEPKREPSKDTPTADQAKKLARAYNKLTEEGIKISQNRLAIEAKVRKSIAAEWLKSGTVVKLKSKEAKK